MDDDLDVARLMLLVGLLAFVVLVSAGASIGMAVGGYLIRRARLILLRVLDVQHRAYASAGHLERSTVALVASAPHELHVNHAATHDTANVTQGVTVPEDADR